MAEPNTLVNHQDRDAPRAWAEANAWLLRVHSGMLSEEERQEFVAWRRRDSTNDVQFRQAERFWQALDGLADQVPKRQSSRDNASVHPTPGQPTAIRRIKHSASKRRWPVALAATVMIVTLAAVFWPILELYISDYHTRAGEQISLALADGSTVHLNTRSALSISLSDQRRGLSLKRGEALFEVAHDPSRPFEVEVNGRVVRAIGTTFNIDHHDRQTAVSVLEGVVRLLYKDEALDIPAGYRITYETDGQPSAPEPFNPPRITAWHRHELLFDDMPLDQIIDQLNRYRIGRIFIVDSQLRARRLSGSIALDDPNHSLAMLQHVLPFQITRLTPYLTFISL